MICLIGCSGSGKSTLEVLLTKYGYRKVVSTTTRPIRDGEVDGIDYHFITEEMFDKLDKQNFFAEKTVYSSWHYGVGKIECTNDGVAVVNPHGFRQLQKMDNLDITSFYIDSTENKRLERLARRGDNIMEIFRRVISDQGVFQNIKEEVDFSIDNNTDDINIALETILNILK